MNKPIELVVGKMTLALEISYSTGVDGMRHTVVRLSGFPGLGDSIGAAHCSRSDNFDRAVGRTLAIERAMQHRLRRDERAQVWQQLREQGVKVRKGAVARQGCKG